MTSSHENDYIQYLKKGNLEAIEQDIVDDWVSLDSHRNTISIDWYDSTTVSTIIRYKKRQVTLNLLLHGTKITPHYGN